MVSEVVLKLKVQTLKNWRETGINTEEEAKIRQMTKVPTQDDNFIKMLIKSSFLLETALIWSSRPPPNCFQLHVHGIGMQETDFCYPKFCQQWPKCKKRKPYYFEHRCMYVIS